MGIKKQNIIELIGSGRYHSAILTTFSFDFYFFEMKAMRWLRSCGIRNINVFVDGHYYSELMNQSSGDEMTLTPGYSLYPVFHSMIFHPKIWMLFGRSEGLLIVGSGNLTNAGNGNNEEIWGAFHFDINHTENLGILSNAWLFLQHITLSSTGQVREKTTEWILENTPWLNEIPDNVDFQFRSTSGNDQVAFLYNHGNVTIWQQMIKLLAREKVTEITCLSPFYDKNGKGINALLNQFPKAEINVVVDTEGSSPENVTKHNRYSFYDWYNLALSRPLNLKNKHAILQSRLHAKIIHFRTIRNSEYCIIGSANLTPEGLGLSAAKANVEAAIMIKCDTGLLSRLGIELGSPVKLNQLKAKRSSTIYESIIKDNSYKVHLLAAEILHSELTLFLDGDTKRGVAANLYDSDGILIETIPIDQYMQHIELIINDAATYCQYVDLCDGQSGKAISNKVLVSDKALLLKSHPNPRNQDLERIVEEIQNGELNKVLDLLHFAMNDVSEDGFGASLGNLQNKTKSEERIPTKKLYDLKTYKVAPHAVRERELLLTSLSLRVWSVVDLLKRGKTAPSEQDELTIDEQEESLDSISGVDEREKKVVRNVSLNRLKSDRRKMINYFDGLETNYLTILQSKNYKDYRVTLTDLSRFQIALELILEFVGKQDRFSETNREKYFTYLPYSGDYDNDNALGCCLNLVGNFLMMIRSGFKQYEFDYTLKKVQELKFEALVASIVCMINCKWTDPEIHYFDTTLLNCLHYLGVKSPSEFKSFWPELRKSVVTRIGQVKHPCLTLTENRNRFEYKVIPAFKRAINKLAEKEFDQNTVPGRILYKSPWGYCFIKEVRDGNNFMLARPGFFWSEKERAFIGHTNDENYNMLSLPQFIEIQI